MSYRDGPTTYQRLREAHGKHGLSTNEMTDSEQSIWDQWPTSLLAAEVHGYHMYIISFNPY